MAGFQIQRFSKQVGLGRLLTACRKLAAANKVGSRHWWTRAAPKIPSTSTQTQP
jgi:hypothetical protein